MTTDINFDRPSFTRAYAASLGWKLILGVLGSALSIGGVLGTWYFGTGHEMRSSTEMTLFVGASLLMAALGMWVAGAAMFTKLLVLTRDELRVPGLMRTTGLARRSIAGYRVTKVQGFDVLEVESRRLGNSNKKTKITMLFKWDGVLAAWFRDIPNLDALEAAAAAREVEQDARLGSSPQERLEKVGRARKIARALQISTFVATAWAIVYPRPYGLSVTVVALIPWIAMWLCWRYKGSFLLDDPGKNSVRADLTMLLLMPWFALALRALADVRLVDATKLVVPSAMGLAFMLACLAWIAPTYRERLGKLVVTALLLSAYPFGSIAIANVMFDESESATYRLPVLAKRHTSGKGAAAFFSVPPWGKVESAREVQVSWELYRQTGIGEDVCVSRHPGALAVEWYAVHAGDGC